MKKCGRCKITKEESDFNKNRSQRDGLDNTCRACEKIVSKATREKQKRHRLELNPPVAEGFKKCFTCKEIKEKSLFYANRAKSGGLLGSCAACQRKRAVYPKSCELEIIYLPHQLSVEEWKGIQIKGMVAPYKISDCGRVLINKTNKIAKPSFDAKGYPQIVLTINKKRVGRRIHILVGEAFLENPNNLPELNHLDGNKLYPHKINLEYSTHKDNLRHADAMGLRKPFNSSNHPLGKKVLDTKTGEIYPSANYVIELFGFPKNSLHRKLNGRTKNNTTFIYV